MHKLQDISIPMLKYTYTALLSICMISHVSGQRRTDINTSPQKTYASNETDNKYRKNWHTAQLKGRVKTIIQFSYNGPAADTTDPEFDTKEHFRYSNTGNLLERITQKEDAAPDRTTYSYNKDNKWTMMSYESGNGITDFNYYNVFDVNGNLVDEGERYADGSTARRLVSEYDQYRGKIKATITGQVTEFKNRYDKAGLLIEEKEYIKGQLSGTKTWKYDNIGHIIEKTGYAADGGLLSKISTSFNKFHLPDSITIIKKGYADNIQAYHYDAQGHEIRQSTKDHQGDPWQTKWEYSYEFDPQGNWTKLVTYNDSHEVAITIIRKIIYY